MKALRDRDEMRDRAADELDRLRAIEAAARLYRDACLACRNAKTELVRDAGLMGIRNYAQAALFQLLDPPTKGERDMPLYNPGKHPDANGSTGEREVPILTLDRGDMFAIAMMANQIAKLQPGHWLCPSEIVRTAVARMLAETQCPTSPPAP
jgi:hypothetical protein